ncbi:MAG TPA: DinB family protein [Acidimicrobiales bacterium]|nr:DinB family protein [Acidimicrobiales bacterium]
MSEWGRATYGDPCEGCGFHWTITREQAVATVTAAHRELARSLPADAGQRRHPDLEWSVVAYVCHVSDNLRIWAERLAGLVGGDSRPVARYDPDLLAEARRYDGIALTAAVWSLDRSVRDWAEAVRQADEAGVILVHPDRGAQSVLDVARSNAHDAHHHCWDIFRTMEVTGGPGGGDGAGP